MAGTGGKRKGAGRKKKADEDRIRDFAVHALEKVYGSEQAGWEYLAEKSKKSFPHLQLLWNHLYGKPKESVNINPDNDFNIPVIKFFGEDKSEV